MDYKICILPIKTTPGHNLIAIHRPSVMCIIIIIVLEYLLFFLSFRHQQMIFHFAVAASIFHPIIYISDVNVNSV